MIFQIAYEFQLLDIINFCRIISLSYQEGLNGEKKGHEFIR